MIVYIKKIIKNTQIDNLQFPNREINNTLVKKYYLRINGDHQMHINKLMNMISLKKEILVVVI